MANELENNKGFKVSEERVEDDCHEANTTDMSTEGISNKRLRGESVSCVSDISVDEINKSVGDVQSDSSLL